MSFGCLGPIVSFQDGSRGKIMIGISRLRRRIDTDDCRGSFDKSMVFNAWFSPPSFAESEVAQSPPDPPSSLS